MSNTLGDLYKAAPKATDEMLNKATLCVFVDVDGVTYSITPRQLKLMLENIGVKPPTTPPQNHNTSQP